jgi:hypothetical protein
MYDVKYPFYARYSSSTRPGVWCRTEETCETDEQHSKTSFSTQYCVAPTSTSGNITGYGIHLRVGSTRSDG